jgi:DNA-directed RNA polymerase specialized sigma24 family protein
MDMSDDDRRTDAQLLAAAERDPAAFGELYRRHVRRVHAWHACRLEWAAADLTAETFARAWVARRGFLRESVRRERIESRARERLGLPTDLAHEDGYAVVEDRLSPSWALAAAMETLPEPPGFVEARLAAFQE